MSDGTYDHHNPRPVIIKVGSLRSTTPPLNRPAAVDYLQSRVAPLVVKIIGSAR